MIKIDKKEIEESIKITAKPIKITVDNLQTTKISIKEEGNEMIESMNLIDLYASKHRENIEKETKGKIEELRKKSDIINKYNELVEKFEKDCDELYLSQFTEEEKKDIIVDKLIGDANKPLQRSYGTVAKYKVNIRFNPSGFNEVMNENQEKIGKVNDLVETAKTHVGIAKTKEEVEEILTRYGIIKKGKLVVD